MTIEQLNGINRINISIRNCVHDFNRLLIEFEDIHKQIIQIQSMVYSNAK